MIHPRCRIGSIDVAATLAAAKVEDGDPSAPFVPATDSL
jgi:hypothetical protein